MQKVADSSSGYTGYAWTKARSPERKGCGFKNIRIRVDGGPNGHREKDSYHSYSLWINSYGTSLNGRFFFQIGK